MDGQSFLRFDGPQVIERWQSADLYGLLVQLQLV
jgi:hypothetical protein